VDEIADAAVAEVEKLQAGQAGVNPGELLDFRAELPADMARLRAALAGP